MKLSNTMQLGDFSARQEDKQAARPPPPSFRRRPHTRGNPTPGPGGGGEALRKSAAKTPHGNSTRCQLLIV